MGTLFQELKRHRVCRAAAGYAAAARLLIQIFGLMPPSSGESLYANQAIVNTLLTGFFLMLFLAGSFRLSAYRAQITPGREQTLTTAVGLPDLLSHLLAATGGY
ncbi:MAG: hypothetical protein R3F50_11420 [Gammaproteobacteria bacterium]|jgi:hypothetical protein